MKKPTSFGKYLFLLDRINVGGMAEVFTAKAFGVEGFERILATYSGKFRSESETELRVPFTLEKEASPPPERQAAKPQPVPKNAATKAPSRSSAKGKLAYRSRPLGAQIWVDGKYSGRTTPAGLGSSLTLPVGSHTVIFKFGGKQSKPQTVNITEGDIAKLINVPVE